MGKTSKSAKVVQVDIVSDIVCPWCWLGYRLFAQAAKQSNQDIQLTWRPYMLDPTVPRDGKPYKDYMRAKFGDGPSDRFKAMRAHLETAGPDVGIDFKFDEIPMRPNTLNAHRLMRWAAGQDLSTEMAEALFQAFFTDQKDVGDANTLTEIAAATGLDADIIADLLGSDKDEAAVTEEIQFFRQLGISGVPTFIYQGQFAVQGAQSPQSHLEAIEKAANLPD